LASWCDWSSDVCSSDLPLVATRRGSFALAPVSAFVPRSAAEGWSGEGKVTVK
jgi:hypothetical protein